MKKKGCIWLFGDGWLKKKVFVMKWTVLLVLLGMLQVSAKVHSQHVAIDLKMENSTIEQVLQRITDQTCLNFFYNNSAIDVYKKISVELKSVSVEEALKYLTGRKYALISIGILWSFVLYQTSSKNR